MGASQSAFRCEPVAVEEATERMQTALRDAGIDPDAVNAALRKHSGGEDMAVIAGSFPLQMVIGERWADTDIDFWVSTYDAYVALLNVMSDAGYPYPRTISMNTLRSTGRYNGLSSSFNEYARLSASVKHIWSWSAPGRTPVQCIMTVKNRPVCEIVSEFDISVCRVTYNGRDVMAMSQETLSEIETRTGHVTLESGVTQSWYEWLRTLRRVIKYSERGFAISWRLVAERVLSAVTGFRPLSVQVFSQWNSIANQSNIVLPTFSFDIFNQTLYFGFKGNALAKKVNFKKCSARNGSCMGIPLIASEPLSEGPEKWGRIPTTCADVIMGEDNKVDDEFFTTHPNTAVIVLETGQASCYDTTQVRQALSYDYNSPLHRIGIGYDERWYTSAEGEYDYKKEGGESGTMDAADYLRLSDAIKRLKAYEKLYKGQTPEEYKQNMKKWYKPVIDLLPRDLLNRDRVVRDIQEGKYRGRYYRIVRHITTSPSPAWINEVFYGCEEGTQLGRNAKPYYMLRMSANYLVPLSDAVQMAVRKTRFYKLVETTKVLQRVASAEAAMAIATSWYRDAPHHVDFQASLVSSDHCQEGTARKVYRLVALDQGEDEGQGQGQESKPRKRGRRGGRGRGQSQK